MNESKRPDPDTLLKQVQEEEARSHRGRLKIFFGSSAGVGKTYAMLRAAHERKAEGIDVVVGLVEHHGRAETLKLLDGLPAIPRKSYTHRDTAIEEFDIDAALARKPGLLILDELAHTNATGARHPKRWQDVEELLEAGIDIYTTLNVQHLESLNDVVARLTGIWVKETIPDRVFDAADDITLVDIPADDLLKRLHEGKVYIAAGANLRAAENFFRKDNLIALRELALRRTAERVDDQAIAYKQREGDKDKPLVAERLMVCIGSDALSARLVRSAKRLAGALDAEWVVAYVENQRHYALSRQAQARVESTLRLAEQLGAETAILYGRNAAATIIQEARTRHITKLIVGQSMRSSWRRWLFGSLVDALVQQNSGIDIHVISGREKEVIAPPPPRNWLEGLSRYLLALLFLALCTGFGLMVRERLEPANLVMVYLLGILATAILSGRGPVLFFALLSVALFNFFLVPPYYTFEVHDSQYFITFAALLITGIIIGTQTTRLKQQAHFAKRRELTTSALYAMTRDFSASRGYEALSQIAARHIGKLFDATVSVWLPQQEQLACLVSPLESHKDLREEAAAQWAFDHEQITGFGTSTMPASKGIYFPLRASGQVLGVIGVIPQQAEHNLGEQADLIETFVNQTASALERAHTAEMAEKAMVDSENEKLRNIILSSVSHDLRTPLASVRGAAGTLLENPDMPATERKELLMSIHNEAERLSGLVSNLLRVTGLESGSIKLNHDYYSLEEIIGAVLDHYHYKWKHHTITPHIDADVPLVYVDGLLIEQLFDNILENAARMSPKGSVIDIKATRLEGWVQVKIFDYGPGIPPGQEEKIFEKFYSAHTEGKRGAGMGLAICKSIVTAHGGKILAENALGGGAVFTFTLPVKPAETTHG